MEEPEEVFQGGEPVDLAAATEALAGLRADGFEVGGLVVGDDPGVGFIQRVAVGVQVNEEWFELFAVIFDAGGVALLQAQPCGPGFEDGVMGCEDVVRVFAQAFLFRCPAFGHGALNQRVKANQDRDTGMFRLSRFSSFSKSMAGVIRPARAGEVVASVVRR